MPGLDAISALVARTLLDARSVVVCGHVNPDGDAIGAAIALALALDSRGVRVTPIFADPASAPATYGYLAGFDRFACLEHVTAPDVFVALDTPTTARLGAAAELAAASGTVVVIDHHADNAGFGDLNLVDAGAASTASLVWDLLPALEVAPDADIATACLTALMTDTGRFSYGNATPRALRDAADMVEAGADLFAIYGEVYESLSPGALRLLGIVLSRITVSDTGRVAYSWLTNDDLVATGAVAGDFENVVDSVRQVGGVDAVAFFKLASTGVRVSLRAKHAGVDVARVARQLGGGGHVAAAGATLDADLAAAIDTVVPMLEEATA